MGSGSYKQKLAAILYADVAGYSRLTGEDEHGTHRTLSAYLDLFTTIIERHGGKVVHFAEIFLRGTLRNRNEFSTMPQCSRPVPLLNRRRLRDLHHPQGRDDDRRWPHHKSDLSARTTIAFENWFGSLGM